MIVGDWKARWQRSDLNKLTGRMTLRQWMLYTASSLIMKYERSRESTNLWDSIEGNLYFNRRQNNLNFVDKSIRKERDF